MAGQVVGYARTSTIEQVAGLEDQLNELKSAGATKVFQEQASGSKKEREQLLAALDYVREGDTFMVTKPDRLARSVRHLLEVKDELTGKGVALRVLSMGLDTGNTTGRLILNVLASVAEFERDLMLERQAAGIARAKAEGKYKGRPNSIDRTAVSELLRAKESPSKIARRMGIGRDSVYRIKKELNIE